MSSKERNIRNKGYRYTGICSKNKESYQTALNTEKLAFPDKKYLTLHEDHCYSAYEKYKPVTNQQKLEELIQQQVMSSSELYNVRENLRKTEEMLVIYKKQRDDLDRQVRELAEKDIELKNKIEDSNDIQE